MPRRVNVGTDRRTIRFVGTIHEGGIATATIVLGALIDGGGLLLGPHPDLHPGRTSRTPGIQNTRKILTDQRCPATGLVASATQLVLYDKYGDNMEGCEMYEEGCLLPVP